MSLKIRLARAGAKKRPYYRIVIADSRSPRDGRYIEKIGTYDPLQPKDSAERVKFVEDRLKHWLGVGAQPTDRVLRFLDVAGIRKRDARSNPNKGQPGKKRLEREEAKKRRRRGEGQGRRRSCRRSSAAPGRARGPGRAAFRRVGFERQARPRAARRDRSGARTEGRGSPALLYAGPGGHRPLWRAGGRARPRDRDRARSRHAEGADRPHQGRHHARGRRGADPHQALYRRARACPSARRTSGITWI